MNCTAGKVAGRKASRYFFPLKVIEMRAIVTCKIRTFTLKIEESFHPPVFHAPSDPKGPRIKKLGD